MSKFIRNVLFTFVSAMIMCTIFSLNSFSIVTRADEWFDTYYGDKDDDDVEDMYYYIPTYKEWLLSSKKCMDYYATDGSIWKYRVMEDGNLEIFYCWGSVDENDGVVSVPQKINGRKVTKIAKYCFEPKIYEYYYGDPDMIDDYIDEAIRKIIIPEGVTDIGEGAFNYRMDVEEIVLPSTLKELNDDFSRCCDNLKKITWPPNVNSENSSLSCDCESSKLETINISYGIKTIERSQFSYNTNVKNVIIPSSVKEINARAFAKCTSLQKVYIYGKNTKIRQYSSYLSKKGYKRKEQHAFADCKNLTIYAPAGGSVEAYAKKNNIPFVAIDKKDDISTYEYGIKLSRETYYYNGKAKRPKVTVKKGRRTLDKKYYSVKYENNVKSGTATVTITGRNGYTGTVTRTFNIRPKTPKGLKASKRGRNISLKWNRVSGVDGYYIYEYFTYNDGKRTRSTWRKVGCVKSADKTSFTVKKPRAAAPFKKGATYKYRIRAYKDEARSLYSGTSNSIKY